MAGLKRKKNVDAKNHQKTTCSCRFHMFLLELETLKSLRLLLHHQHGGKIPAHAPQRHVDANFRRQQLK
jgi:hypothetical protein